MNIQTYISRTLLTVSLLCFASYSYALSEDSVSQKSQISQANQSGKLGEKVIKQAYSLLNQIACMMSDLVSVIQGDETIISNKEEKQAFIQELRGTSKVITRLSRDLDNNPTQGQLQLVLDLLKLLFDDLKESLGENLIAYKAFDVDEHIKKSRTFDNTTLTEEQLLGHLTDFEKEFKDTQEKASGVGLNKFNLLVRKVDPFIQWCGKHNVHWKALYATTALAALGYIWHHTNKSIGGLPEHLKLPINRETIDPQWTADVVSSVNPEDSFIKRGLWSLHDKINYIIRNYTLWPVHASRDTMNDNSVARKIGLFGHIEKAIWDAKIGYWTLAGIAYEPIRNAVARTFQEYSIKAQNKVHEWYAWAKGGAYYQRFKNKKGLYGRIDPRFTFDDIIGLDHAKEILGNVVKYMQDPESYDRAGLTPAKGYLLIGPSRTGKTMIAEALAGEIKKALGTEKELPFYSIEARWIAAEGNFKWMMDIVRENAPCIIFIDEIDMLNLHRDKFKDKTVLLSEFLSTLSGCMNSDPDKQVIIIAATNKPENLDKSLLARFGVHIPFEYPSFLNRAEFFLQALEGKGLAIDQFDIKKLAEQTENCAFETLHKVLNNAQFITREQGRPLGQEDIEKSLNTEIHGIIYQNYVDLPTDDEHILAVHIAGHAIAYMVTEGTGVKMFQATIRPVNSKVEKESVLAECLKDITLPHVIYGHVFTHYKADSLKFISQKEIERLCMIELAGHVAEKLMFGSHHCAKNTCSQHDTSKAFYWARKHQLNGLDEQLIAKSMSLQDKITKEAYAFMQQCEDKIRTVLESRIELIKLVSEALQGVATVSGEDMQMLMEIHAMLKGKTIEEFVKEMQEAEALEASGSKAASELTDTSNAFYKEFGIEETVASA